MKKSFSYIDTIFIIELGVVILTALGILPREAFLFLGALIITFCTRSSLEDCVFFIARSIPLFVALPLTSSFDSFNIWRIIVFIVFIKFVFQKNVAPRVKKGVSLFFKKPKSAYTQYKIEFLILGLFIINALSLFVAQDTLIGIKRLIYFSNLGMLFFVVREVINEENLPTLALDIGLSSMVVILTGFVQLISTYFLSIDMFANFWALQIQRALYGNAWANIVINANTWFAYFQDTIHLRMFASFPDSHSFPLFLIMALVFIIWLFFKALQKRHRRAYTYGLLIASGVFEIVLSGTRGVWAAIIFPLFTLMYIIIRYREYRLSGLVAIAPLLLFIFFLPFSSLIFGSQQFRLSGNAGQEEILFRRIKSIIDISETSNNGRIFIWKETLKSIKNHPLLGVGIGNFPTILKQNPTAIKAGSSAHNIYLHIMAESGIGGFILFMLILYEILRNALRLSQGREEGARLFGLLSFFYIIWILCYSMTDVAIFDERSFLMLMILTGAIFALNTKHHGRTISIR